MDYNIIDDAMWGACMDGLIEARQFFYLISVLEHLSITSVSRDALYSLSPQLWQFVITGAARLIGSIGDDDALLRVFRLALRSPFLSLFDATVAAEQLALSNRVSASVLFASLLSEESGKKVAERAIESGHDAVKCVEMLTSVGVRATNDMIKVVFRVVDERGWYGEVARSRVFGEFTNMLIDEERIDGIVKASLEAGKYEFNSN